MSAASQHASVEPKLFNSKNLLKWKTKQTKKKVPKQKHRARHMATTESCADQTVNQWLWLTKKCSLPSVDTGTCFPSLFSSLIRIIPVHDFVVSPIRKLSPSSFSPPYSFSLYCCPMIFLCTQPCMTKRQHQNKSKPDFQCVINLK